tara:strand:- start:229 stop:1293 length:1065 start_codon:yes stop_codon:yes gene_type:complete
MFLEEINSVHFDLKKIKMTLDLDLNEVYENFKKKKKFYNYTEKDIFDFNTEFFINSYNYPKKIKNSIIKLKKFKKIKYKFNNTEVCINLYYNNFSKKNINKIINLINFNIILFEKINNKTRNNVNLNILATNHKKKININKTNQLNPENINSGYTQSFVNINDDLIVIYRNEELFKVITHEMIHLYNLHPSEKFDTKINKLIKNNNDNFSIYESYTEAFAIIYYSYYYSRINNLDFKEVLNSQVKFNYIQCSKLLHSQNIKDINNNYIIKEKTNAISYYLLKSCILTNLNFFKKMFNKKNGFLLENKNRVLNFDKILIKSFNSEKKEFNKYLNLNIFNKINTKLLKTFRMNILD